MLAALALPAHARAAAKPFFDVRAQAQEVEPPAATRALERRLGDQAVVELDDVTRTPRVLARLDGTLSGPVAGGAEEIALRYVRANLAALGLEERDLDTLGTPTTTSSRTVTTVRWRQAVDGIAAADSELRVNVTGDGRVLSVLGAPAPGLDADTTPTLTAGEAVRVVQDDSGVYRSLPRKRGPSGAARSTTYADDTTAALALYTGRLAWRVTYRAGDDAVYDVMVDASNGKLLRRANLVKSAKVWENHPGTGPGGQANDVDFVAKGWLPAGADKLAGDNVHAYTDVDDDGRPDPQDEVDPRAYTFAPFGSCDPVTPCSWSGAGDSWKTNLQQNAVQAFYLANRFHDHLRAAPIGFTDRSFEGTDRLLLETSDGADVNQRNNAYMYTPPDGSSPLMQMQLWSANGRNVNGGDDASILYHEYTHGLSNRLVHDADGAGALNSPQAGAMGEGWSDWYAKDFLVEQGYELDAPAIGDLHMGSYVGTWIRKQALDCPVGASQCAGAGTAGPGGFTYGDLGKIEGEAEVHADGEIWAQTLWDLRSATSSEVARELITDGMRLSPPEPSFLDMRNAILLAAAPALRPAIWSVFAKRGMGFYASTTGSEDTEPAEDFSTPPAAGGPRGTIAGRITDAATGAPLAGADAAVAGSAELADETDASGGYTIAAPPNTYTSFVFSSPGYDRLITPVTVAAAQTTALDAALRRNWAARAGGASSLGGDDLAPQGCGSAAAIDQHPGTAWSTVAANSSMVVTLPKAIDVASFGVDPGEGCGDGSEAAAGRVTIETRAAGDWTLAATRDFVDADRHRMNEVLPTAGKTRVQQVRVTIVSTQHSSTYRDISEFAVYSAMTTPTPTPTAQPTVTPEPTVEATPTASPDPTPTPVPQSAVPTALPTPAPGPLAQTRPTFQLAASGKRSIRVGVRCLSACVVNAELKVDAKTARRLGLGKSRVAGTKRSSYKGGTAALTVALNTKARRGSAKLRSFKATLTVRSGSTVATRKVTIRR